MQELIKQINALSKKEKEQGLTKEEKELQAKLREQYRKEFRKNFQAQINNVDVKLPSGKVVPLTTLGKKKK